MFVNKEALDLGQQWVKAAASRGEVEGVAGPAHKHTLSPALPLLSQLSRTQHREAGLTVLITSSCRAPNPSRLRPIESTGTSKPEQPGCGGLPTATTRQGMDSGGGSFLQSAWGTLCCEQECSQFPTESMWTKRLWNGNQRVRFSPVHPPIFLQRPSHQHPLLTS